MSSQTITSQPHGMKRRGDDTLESDQRLSKRFNLLNLEHNGKLWVPVNAVQQRIATKTPLTAQGLDQRRQSDYNDSMQVDDTKDRVYIHNLDEEIASIEAEEGEDKLIFLPDIEKKLKKLTNRVLNSGDAVPQVHGNELVLYNVPTSLSVPAEQDSVRKAILESRARARESQQEASRDAMLHDQYDTTNADDAMETEVPDVDPNHDQDYDAMDIG